MEFVSLRDAAFYTTSALGVIGERAAAGTAAIKRRGGWMGHTPIEVDVDVAAELMER